MSHVIYAYDSDWRQISFTSDSRNKSRMNESRTEWVTYYIAYDSAWRQVSFTSDSCNKSQMNESRTEWVTYYIAYDSAWRQVSFINESWLIHESFKSECVLTHLYVIRRIHVRHDSFGCDMTYMWHVSFIIDMTRAYVTWLLHILRDSFICDVTRSYITWPIYTWHDSFVCDVTPSCVTWLLHM